MKLVLLFAFSGLLAFGQEPANFASRVAAATTPMSNRVAPPNHAYQKGEGKIIIIVLGHVPRPGAYPLEKSALLIDALEAAGGINFPNYWRYNYTTRKDEKGASIKIMFSENKVETYSMKLKEGDTIYISDADL
jgi:hypothetical protein